LHGGELRATSSSPAWRDASGRILINVCIAIGCVALAVVAYMGAQASIRAKEARLMAAKELAAADRSRAEENLRESAARREAEAVARDERNQERIQRALDKLRSDQPMTQCDGALELGRLNARDHVDELTALLWSERAHNARGCAAGALVRMGQKATALAAYVAWAGGTDSDMRRSALAGFGEIGPEAADAGMPFLTEAMKSPHLDVRVLASLSISKVQPPAPQAAPAAH
jgi:hypothetical protein